MDGSITIKTNIDDKSFDAQIEKLELKLERLENEYKDMHEQALKSTEKFGGVINENAFVDIRAEIEATRNSLSSLYTKQQETNFNKLEESAKRTSISLDGIIKKVAKWGLAVFGVRSAYTFVRQAISTLSTQNKNLAKDIQNIKYGLESAVAPIIQKLVQWAYKLMQAINYIWKVMTGKNLFSNMKKDLNSSNKSAKQLQKTIAGFDEMNILNEQSSSGGISDIESFTEDLTATNLLSDRQKEILEKIAGVLKEIWNNILKPMWEDVLKPIGNWLIEHPKELLAILTGILALKLASKLTKLGTILGKGIRTFSDIVGATNLWAGALLALDVILVSKIVKTIKDELIPTIKETKKQINDTKKVLKQGTKNTKEMNDAVVEYSKSENANADIVKMNNDILLKRIVDNKSLIKQHEEEIDLVGKLTGENKLHTEAIKENKEELYSTITALGKLAEQHSLTDKQANLFILTLKDQIDTLELENQKLDKNSEKYKNNQKKINELKVTLDKTKGEYKVDVKAKTEGKDKVDDLKNSVSKVEGTHKIKLQAETKQANKTIGEWLKGLGKSLVTTLMPKVDWSSLKKKFGFAKGGIINQPGRGVPLTSAIGGEKGQEGVIPLTDSQQMSLLGEAIGKFITINASITNTMNGRVISRELQKIQNESNFANNR